MNKYYQNIIAIVFIVIISLFLFSYWLNLSFGYGQVLLIIGGGVWCISQPESSKKRAKTNVSNHA